MTLLRVLFVCFMVGFSMSQDPYVGLQNFYESTDGGNWFNNTNWANEISACFWYGVGCNGQGYPGEFTLGTNNLNGTIVSTFFTNIVEMWKFDVSDNNLRSTIPDSLSTVSQHLNHLDVSDNFLTGDLSTLGYLSDFKNLSYVDLSTNTFSGNLPPVWGNGTFKHLDVSDNLLSGTIPSEYENLDLDVFLGNDNSFSGDFPEWLCQVQWFSFSGSSFNCPLPDCCIEASCGSPTYFDCTEIGPSPTPSPTPSPIPSPTPSPNPSPTPTPTPSPTPSPNPSPNPSPTPTPSITPSPSPTVSPSPTPTVSPSPTPTISPSPTPTFSPSPSPIPSPTPFVPCEASVSLASSNPSPDVSIFLTASTTCGAGSYEWTYTELYDIIEGFATVDSGNLCTGDSPKARCSGNNVEIIAGSFSHNTTVRIEVKFITETRNDPTDSLDLTFPAASVSTTLSVGTTNQDSMQLEASYVNANTFTGVTYLFGCVPQNPSSGCPYCPGDDGQDVTSYITYFSQDPVLNLNFSSATFTNSECVYNVDVTITFSNQYYSFADSDSSTATLFETISTPIVTFDFDGSTCGSVVSGNALDFRLIGVPDDGSVEITWTQVQGQSVGNCPNGVNCGGDGNSFLYIPFDELEDCETYEWEATVTYGSPSQSYVVSLCDVDYLAPPNGGTCSPDYGTDTCASPLDTVVIACTGFTAACGSSFTQRVLKESEAGNNTYIEVETAPLSGAIAAPFEDTDYTVELCNNGACTFVVVTIEVCEGSNTSAAIDNGLEETGNLIDEENLEEALQVMVALSDAELGCDDVETLVTLIEGYIDASLNAVGNNAANLPDTSTLMELMGTIGEKECNITEELFNSLFELCSSPVNGDVQTFALNFLLANLIQNTAQDRRLNAVDEALLINECSQPASASDTCGISLPNLYSGDSFYYAQHVVSLEELEAGLTLEGPNTAIFLPEGFNDQISHDYLSFYNETVIGYSCVIISMVETNTILDTSVSNVSSGIFGVNFYVYVNGQALNVPVGHEGINADDVTLRINIQGGSSRRDSTRDARQIVVVDQQCAYYLDDGNFETEGCRTINVTETQAFCSCDHFSNFALKSFSSFFPIDPDTDTDTDTDDTDTDPFKPHPPHRSPSSILSAPNSALLSLFVLFLSFFLREW